MKNLSLFTTVLSIAVSLVSCSKDEIDTSANTYEPDEFMAMSEMKKTASELPCGDKLREVRFKVNTSHSNWSNVLSNNPMLRYHGAHPSSMEWRSVNHSRYKRPFLKNGHQVYDTTVPFIKEGNYGMAIAYIASYNGNHTNGTSAHYSFSLVDTSITDGSDQRIEGTQQNPVWGSCTGNPFDKNINSLFDLVD